MEKTDKQHKKQYSWLKEYQWKPGQSGNLKGRPKGRTLKEWAKLFLQELPDEQKLEFLKEIAPDTVWQMAEGRPKDTTDLNIEARLEVDNLAKKVKELLGRDKNL